MRIALLGASNSLMKPGYVPELVRLLERRGGSVRLDNLSLGAATVFHGIGLCDRMEPDAYDLVLVESAVTDAPMINRRSIGLWRAAADALLARLRAAQPRARIVVAFLGADLESFHAHVASMRRGWVALCAAHGTEFEDVAGYVEALIGQAPPARAAAWSDPAHYARPVTTALVAHRLMLRLDGPARPPDWPDAAEGADAPWGGPDLRAARRIDAPGLAARADEAPPLVRFANAAFDVEAIEIGEDRPLTLDLPGALIVLTTVSRNDSGILWIERDGAAPVGVPTRSSLHATQGRDFVLRPHFPLRGLKRDRGGPVRLSVRRLGDVPRPALALEPGLPPEEGPPGPLRVRIADALVAPPRG